MTTTDELIAPIQRWTSAHVMPSEQGGFVAYGDYLALLTKIESLQRERDEAVAKLAALLEPTEEMIDAACDIDRDELKKELSARRPNMTPYCTNGEYFRAQYLAAIAALQPGSAS